MELDLNCVLAFVLLLDEKHFAHAAAQMNLTPSAFSKRIQKLESQLGVVLVERDPGSSFAVTAAGARFAPHARRLLTSADEARLAARHDQTHATFRLGVGGEVGAFPDAGRLAALATVLRHDVPGAVLRCYGVPFPQLATVLLRGIVDVMWNISPLRQPGLTSLPLEACGRVGIVHEDHPLADASEMSAEEFADYPMIYSPHVPATWMAPLCLSDVRPLSEARLVEISATNTVEVMERPELKTAVTVTPDLLAGLTAPYLRVIPLTGLPHVTTFASSRQRDDREPVLRLLAGLKEVAYLTPVEFAPERLAPISGADLIERD